MFEIHVDTDTLESLAVTKILHAKSKVSLHVIYKMYIDNKVHNVRSTHAYHSYHILSIKDKQVNV